MLIGKSLFSLAILVSAFGCSSGDDAAPAAVRGTTKKGDPCTKDLDCAEKDAKCRAGNVCTGALGGVAFETECAAGGAAACSGLTCIGLKTNLQGKTGLCSLSCTDDASCGPEAACVSFGTAKGCLSLCATNADCANGFACVEDPNGLGAGRRACFVTTM